MVLRADTTGRRGCDSGTIFWMPASPPAPEPSPSRRWRPSRAAAGSVLLHLAAVPPRCSRARRCGPGHSARCGRPAAPVRGGPVAAQHAARAATDAPAEGGAACGHRPHHRRWAGSGSHAAVLQLLAAAGARATFFCVGERVRQHPAARARDPRRGPRLENHSEHHSMRFSLLGPRGDRAGNRRAQDCIREVTGEVAQFFRAPAGLRNPLLDPVLAHANLRLASWTRRGFDTRTTDPDGSSARSPRRLAGGDILLLHDGHAARTARGAPVILEVLPRLLARLARARGCAPSRCAPPSRPRGARMSAPGSAPRALLRHASAYYRAAGRFAWHFARGKLKGDPVFRAILARACSPAAHACSTWARAKALLAAWLLAARSDLRERARRGTGRAGGPRRRSCALHRHRDQCPQEVRRARQRACALISGASRAHRARGHPRGRLRHARMRS